MKLNSILFIAAIVGYIAGRIHQTYIDHRDRSRPYVDKTFQHSPHYFVDWEVLKREHRQRRQRKRRQRTRIAKERI